MERGRVFPLPRCIFAADHRDCEEGRLEENVSEDDVHLMLELLNQLWERGSLKVYNSIIAGGWLITIAGVCDAEKM